MKENKKTNPEELLSCESAPVLISNPSSNSILLLPAVLENEQNMASASNSESTYVRPRTKIELELDNFIQKRQGIIDQLKLKNAEAIESRNKLASLIPLIRGKGASKVLDLAREVERLEFSISTEAYTPKKEKELLKQIRGLKFELSKHKDLDDKRKMVDAQRTLLNSIVMNIKALERELYAIRKQCDTAYALVVAERKASYEKRKQVREDREKRKYNELYQRVKRDNKRQYESEIKKYMKNYDDTVSMEEICIFEKKEKKKGKQG